MQKIISFDHNQVHYHVFRFNGNTDSATVKNAGAYETIEHAVSQGANVIVNVSSGNNADALRKEVLEYNRNKPIEDRVKVIHIIGESRELERGLSEWSWSIPIVSDNLNTRWLTSSERVNMARRYLETYEPNFKIKGMIDATHYLPKENVRQAMEITETKIDGNYLNAIVIPVGGGRTITAFDTALAQIKNQCTKLIGLVPEGEHPLFHNFIVRKENPDGI